MDQHSSLFPSITPEDYAEATRYAEQLSGPAFTCDADDVLLAMHMSGVAKGLLAAGMKSKALARLCDETSVAHLYAMVSLAKELREIRNHVQADVTHDAIKFVNVLAAVLHFIAPDRNPKKHPRG